MVITQEPIRRSLPGVALKIALGNDGVLSILTRDERQDHQLAGFDLNGKNIFSVPLPHNTRSLRLGADQTIWVGLSASLQQYDSGGNLLRTLRLQTRENENLGSFLLLPDGFIVALQNESSRKADGHLLRLDAAGNTLWTTAVIPEMITYPGLVRMSPGFGERPRPAPPWRPRTWVTHYQQPLLLNGQTLLAHFYDHPATDIGVLYGLDVHSGVIRWTTEPRPYAIKAIAGPESFLFSAQGYGAFDSWQYNTQGEVRQHWPSHGYFLVTETSEIRVVEMGNSLPSRLHFVVLRADGTVQQGPHLPGYYTSYPVTDRQGNSIFWRHGELILVDQHLEMQVLATENHYPPQAFPSRMLLAGQGQLLFALEDQLRIYQTNLASLAHSPWPCGQGTLLNNPVQ